MTAIARQARPAARLGAKGEFAIEQLPSAVRVSRPASNREWPGAVYAATNTIAIAIAALSVTLGLHGVNASEPVVPLDALVFAAVIYFLGRLVYSCAGL
jgi:hypothetical protein